MDSKEGGFENASISFPNGNPVFLSNNLLLFLEENNLSNASMWPVDLLFPKGVVGLGSKVAAAPP